MSEQRANGLCAILSAVCQHRIDPPKTTPMHTLTGLGCAAVAAVKNKGASRGDRACARTNLRALLLAFGLAHQRRRGRPGRGACCAGRLDKFAHLASTHRAKLLLTLAAAAADILAAEHFRQQSSMPAALLQRISSAIRHTKSACPQSTEVLAQVAAAEHNMSLVVQKFGKQAVAQRTLALLQHEE